MGKLVEKCRFGGDLGAALCGNGGLWLESENVPGLWRCGEGRLRSWSGVVLLWGCGFRGGNTEGTARGGAVAGFMGVDFGGLVWKWGRELRECGMVRA